MKHRRQTYSEEVANTITHGLGMLFGIVAIVLLLSKAIKSADPWVIASFFVYGLGMTLSYVTSTFYHASRKALQKRYLRKWDHSAIYIHIAATYTPFTLVTIRHEGGWGWSIFAVVWLAAIVGIVITSHHMKRTNHLKTLSYLALGCVVLVAIKPLLDVFSRMQIMYVLYWLVAGGAFYVVGTIFYSLSKYQYMHPVWHLFVLGGSVCHFIAIYNII